MTADDLISAARGCLGTPFRHQGRVPGEALDCAGLLAEVARANGCQVIDRQGYSPEPSGDSLLRAVDAQPYLIRLPGGMAEAAAGDVLALRFGGAPHHLALHCGATIVHAWAAVGCVCAHELTAALQRRVVAAWRFRGLVA